MATKRTPKRVTIQEEDLNMLREIYTMVGEMKGIVEATRDQTAENTRTLRGHNGTPGLLTMFCNLENKVNDIDGKVEAVKTAIKDIPTAIDTMKRYPSLTWMVRHNFKEMSLITVSVLLLTTFVSFPNHYFAERLQVIVEIIITKWLSL